MTVDPTAEVELTPSDAPDGPDSEPVRFAVAWGAATDRGRRRSINEDRYLAAPPIFIVADGMGGHLRGDAAAAAVVEAFHDVPVQPRVSSEWLHAAVSDAARRVRQVAATAQPAPGAPGSTLSGVGLTEQAGQPCWLVFNVGDSRTYRLRAGILEQVSVDHSEVQELLDAGRIAAEDVRHHAQRSVITRAIGGGLPGEPVVDQWLLLAAAGDRVLVCSDGLTGEVSESLIAATLLSHEAPQDAADALVRAAVEAGGRDNVTVVVVDAVDVSADPSLTLDEDTLGDAVVDLEHTLPLGMNRAKGESSR